MVATCLFEPAYLSIVRSQYLHKHCGLLM